MLFESVLARIAPFVNLWEGARSRKVPCICLLVWRFRVAFFSLNFPRIRSLQTTYLSSRIAKLEGKLKSILARRRSFPSGQKFFFSKISKLCAFLLPALTVYWLTSRFVILEDRLVVLFIFQNCCNWIALKGVVSNLQIASKLSILFSCWNTLAQR